MKNFGTQDVLRTAALADEMELPAPPAPSEVGAPTSGMNVEGACGAEIPSDLYDTIPDKPEEMPKGVGEFHIDSYDERMTDLDKDNQPTAKSQPYFNLKLVCQYEPHVGRVLFDFVPWVKDEDVRDAKDTSSPRNTEARRILKDRLWKSKQIVQSANYQSQGKMSFKQFLDTQPVVKVSHKLKAKKEATGAIDPKTGKKVYAATSDMQAVVDKYLPLT